MIPLPRSVARFNRRVTNRVLGPLAPRLPGFGVVVHRGRRSGRAYRTPVNVFARPGGVVVALAYGPNSDWSATSWPMTAAHSRRVAGRNSSGRRGSMPHGADNSVRAAIIGLRDQRLLELLGGRSTGQNETEAHSAL